MKYGNLFLYTLFYRNILENKIKLKKISFAFLIGGECSSVKEDKAIKETKVKDRKEN